MSLIRGDALTIPLADNTADLIVSSPPYFALRSYTDDGDHYAGQLGSEATPAAFIDALVSVTRECVRVLKPSGSLFVNLGDKYAGSDANGKAHTGGLGLGGGRDAGHLVTSRGAPDSGGMRTKSLMGLPWRYALRCIDDLGLILRAEIIWSKPNGLPESVQDRVRRSHEQWFHFTLEPRYYSAVDEIRESYTESSLDRAKYATDKAMTARMTAPGEKRDKATPGWQPDATLGKLPGSVWTVPTEPLRVPDHLPQHFAAFPSEFPRRIILGWSPSGICTVCGEGRRPVVEREPASAWHWEERRDLTEADVQRFRSDFGIWLNHRGWSKHDLAEAIGVTWYAVNKWTDHPTQAQVPSIDQWEKVCRWHPMPLELTEIVRKVSSVKVPDGQVNGRPTTKMGQTESRSISGTTSNATVSMVGEACACTDSVGAGQTGHAYRPGPPTGIAQANRPLPATRKAVVLDPFAGTGTTVAVANTLGRFGIGIDLSADYLRLARWRCQDPGLRAKVLGVDKPAPEVPGQMALL